jgi:hypothetical protein
MENAPPERPNQSPLRAALSRPRAPGRDELKRLKTSPENPCHMSQATRIVLGVIGVSVVIGLLLIVAVVLL